jgi:hypothetical protein
MLTIITMYRAYDAEILVNVVDGQLTAEQRQQWRDTMGVPEDTDEDTDDQDYLFFREVPGPIANNQLADLLNADGETYP